MSSRHVYTVHGGTPLPADHCHGDVPILSAAHQLDPMLWSTRTDREREPR